MSVACWIAIPFSNLGNALAISFKRKETRCGPQGLLWPMHTD